MQQVRSCSRLVPNLFLKHKSVIINVSFALRRGEIKAKNRDALCTYMDILKTGLDTY